MQKLTFIPLLLFLSQTASSSNNGCRKFTTRKEFRDMTSSEWLDFHNAMMQLQERPDPSGLANSSDWDSFTKVHIDHMHEIHGHARFFPWHRAYVLSIEQRLQQFNPNVSIPYWDWTFDYMNPLSSPIFSEEYGLAVNLDENGDCRYPRRYFQKHCLRRDYNASNFPVYYSAEAVSTVISVIKSYDEFRELIEMVPHALIHTSIGGVKGDMGLMNSPNDPLFWLHHSMVDYIWWIWQRQNQNISMNYNGGDVDEVLKPYGVKVSDLLDTNRLCYTYEPFSKNTKLLSHPSQNVDVSEAKALFRREPTEVRHWIVPQGWLDMNHITVKQFHNIVNKFNDIVDGCYRAR